MLFLINWFVVINLTSGGIVNYKSDNKNLLAVIQIFRHGHRTPSKFYANDPYADKSYWYGLNNGELTNIGRRQLYSLGQFSRRRYDNWLSHNYNKDEFYAQTTDVDRSHMSAQTAIYGMYPITSKWKPKTDWQAIPVHQANADIFHTSPEHCNKYVLDYARYKHSKEYYQINDQYIDLFKYLTNMSGNNISNIDTSLMIYDCFKSELEAGLKLPEWAASVYPQPLTNLSAIILKTYTHTTKFKRLGTGTFFHYMIQTFENITQNLSSYKKYQMFSGHDMNVAMILGTLGAFNPPYPPHFGSSLYIELRNNTDKYYINIWSKDRNNFKPIKIKGCDMDCPLTQLKEILKDIIIDVDTKKAECGRK